MYSKPPDLSTLIALHVKPAPNAVDNVHMRDSIGNKDDNLFVGAWSTVSIMSYIKGLTQFLDQLKTAKAVNYEHTGDTFADAVNISDKGVLTGVSVLYHAVDTNYAYVKITIDGVVVLPGTVYFGAGDATHIGNNNSLAFFHRFNTSLRVEVKCGASKYAKFCVSYTTD